MASRSMLEKRTRNKDVHEGDRTKRAKRRQHTQHTQHDEKATTGEDVEEADKASDASDVSAPEGLFDSDVEDLDAVADVASDQSGGDGTEDSEVGSGQDDDESNETNDSDDEDDTKYRPHPSKRNDASRFSTSIRRILAAKGRGGRDPLVSRSRTARDTSRLAADAGLEQRARTQLIRQRQAALERGRVRDVLETSPAADERRLRKTATRGVARLFNALRDAQVHAAEAERSAAGEQVVGYKAKEARVAEMSRKGFLDLIAGAGGGLRREPMEEA